MHVFLSTIHTLLTVHALTIKDHETALALAELHEVSIDDAMIAASSTDAERNTLWSEDMHDGMVIQDQMRIANPFRAA